MSYEEIKLLESHLLDYYKRNESDYQKIGLEVEKVGIKNTDWKPPSYVGKDGYLAILGRLKEELGWNIVKTEGKYIMEMERQGTHLALESDGRIELAGRPHESIHDLAREFRLHQNEISEISDIFGVKWLGVGYHPFSMNKDIKGMPSMRKEKIYEFYHELTEKTGNDFGLAVYKKTSGIHVNIDYSSEEDFSLKTKVLFRLIPVLSAIFANSPFSKKQFTGYMDYRRYVDSNTGIPRHTISQRFYESDVTYKDWIDEVTDYPILFLFKNNEWIYPHKNFKSYMQEGYDDYAATMNDFDFHIRTLWMGVRVKNVIEIRCFDSQPPHLVPSVAAFIKGLVYNQNNLNALKKMTDKWTYVQWKELEQESAKHGLQAKIEGKKLIYLAEELLSMAEKSLKESKILDYYGNDESIHLAPIQEFIYVKGKSPAEWLVEEWYGKWNKNFFPVTQWWSY